MADQAGEVVAAVRPRWRQIRPEHRVGDEQQRDDRHDQPGGAPRRLQQQHDEDHAQRDVEPVRHGGAVGEVLPAPERVAEDRDRSRRRQHVEPADVVAKPRRNRKQQERQHHDERHVDVAQRLRRDDVVGGVELEQGHRHRDAGDDVACDSGQAVGRALLGLHKGLGLAQRFVRNGALGGQSRVGLLIERRLTVLGHAFPYGFLPATLARQARSRYGAAPLAACAPVGISRSSPRAGGRHAQAWTSDRGAAGDVCRGG